MARSGTSWNGPIKDNNTFYSKQNLFIVNLIEIVLGAALPIVPIEMHKTERKVKDDAYSHVEKSR